MKSSRGKRFAKITLSTVLAALLLASGGYLIMVGLAPIPTTLAKSQPLPSIVADPAIIDFPASGSGAVKILGLPESEFHYGSEQSLAIASITKIITALVVLEHHPLEPNQAGATITMTGADVDIFWQHVARNGSVTPVTPGWQFSQREMLEIILIPSSNNYADALARWAFGSAQGYVDTAQTWLSDQGLTGTTVVDANGLSQLNQSTSTDLLHIAELVLEHPVLSEIVNTTSTVVPNLGQLQTTNLLLQRFPDFSGIKTGTTSVAGACLLWSSDFEVNGKKYTAIGVSLGGSTQTNLAPQVEQIFRTAIDEEFQELALVRAGEIRASYETLWGERLDAVVDRSIWLTVYGEARLQGSQTLTEVQLVEQGETLGQVQYDYQGKTLSANIVAKGHITGPDFWWRMMNPDKLLW